MTVGRDYAAAVVAVVVVVVVGLCGVGPQGVAGELQGWSTPQGGVARAGHVTAQLPNSPLFQSWRGVTDIAAFGTMLTTVVDDTATVVGMTDVALSVWNGETGQKEYEWTVFRWKGSHQLQGISLWPTLAGAGATLVASVSNSGEDVAYLRVNVAAWELKTGQPIWFFTPPAPEPGTSIGGISCAATVGPDSPSVWCLGNLFVQSRSYTNVTLYELDPANGTVRSEHFLFQRSIGLAYLDETEGIVPTLSEDGKTLYVPYGEFDLVSTSSTRVAAYDLTASPPKLKWSVSSGAMNSQTPSVPAALVSPSILAVPLETGGTSSTNPSTLVLLDARTGATVNEVDVPNSIAWVAGGLRSIFVGGSFDHVIEIPGSGTQPSSKLSLTTMSGSYAGVVGIDGMLYVSSVSGEGFCSVASWDPSQKLVTQWSSPNTECGSAMPLVPAANNVMMVGAWSAVTAQCLAEPCPLVSPPPPPPFTPWSPSPTTTILWQPYAIIGSIAVVFGIVFIVLCLRSRARARRRRESYGQLGAPGVPGYGAVVYPAAPAQQQVSYTGAVQQQPYGAPPPSYAAAAATAKP